MVLRPHRLVKCNLGIIKEIYMFLCWDTDRMELYLLLLRCPEAAWVSVASHEPLQYLRNY